MNITFTCDRCGHHNPYDPCEITVVAGIEAQAWCGECEHPIHRHHTEVAAGTWLALSCHPDVLRCGPPSIDRPNLGPLTIGDVVEFVNKLAHSAGLSSERVPARAPSCCGMPMAYSGQSGWYCLRCGATA